MKKVISILMSAALCGMLASCGGSSDNMTSGSNVQAIESVVVTQPDLDNDHESSNEEVGTPSAIEGNNESTAQPAAAEAGSGEEAQPTVSDGSELPAQTSARETEQTAPVQEFGSIEIEVTTGTLYITVGDTLSFVRRDGTVLDYSIANGTLYAANDSSHTATLTLPRDGSYDEIRLVINEGHVFAEQAINTASLSVIMNKGEASLEQALVSGSSLFDINKGSLYIHGDIGSTVTAACDEGHLSMEVPYSQNDYNFELEVSEGNLQIGTQSFHGRNTSKSIDNGAERNAELSGRRGDISMQFNR